MGQVPEHSLPFTDEKEKPRTTMSISGRREVYLELFGWGFGIKVYMGKERLSRLQPVSFPCRASLLVH